MLFFSLVLAFAATNAVAPPETSPAPEQTARPAKPAKLAKDDPNRIICKREATIGSRVSAKKVCKTQADWKTLAQESKDYSNGVQQKSGEVRNGG
jgi:hypothetical protein